MSNSFDKDVWYVLGKLKELLRYTKSTSISHHEYFGTLWDDPSNKISWQAETMVLQRLAERDVIKIRSYELTNEDYRGLTVTGPNSATSKNPIPPFASIEVMPKKLESVYGEYELKNQAIESRGTTVLFSLTNTGRLSRILKNGSEQVYKMEPNKKKHSLIKILAERNGEPLTADELAEELETTAKNIRKEIGEIRKEIGDHFGISGTEFIPEAQKGGAGYALGQQIKIKRKH